MMGSCSRWSIVACGCGVKMDQRSKLGLEVSSPDENGLVIKTVEEYLRFETTLFFSSPDFRPRLNRAKLGNASDARTRRRMDDTM
jgi:hypothetical protein